MSPRRNLLGPGGVQSLFQTLLVSLHHLLDHLATDGTGLLGGQVAVVALLQVDAHLVGGLHLEAVQTLASLGNHVLLVHTVTPLCHTRRFCRRKIDLRLQTYCVPLSGKYHRQFVTKKRLFANQSKHTPKSRFFHYWLTGEKGMALCPAFKVIYRGLNYGTVGEIYY